MEDVNTKKVKQLQTQYVYLAINRRATTAICGKCKSFKHQVLDTKALKSTLN
jgi:hypothetical protein